MKLNQNSDLKSESSPRQKTDATQETAETESTPILKLIQQYIWRFFAVVFLILALIGIPIPGLPTVPFLLLAAWCSGHGWPRLERWLLNHPKFGPPIKKWREHGVVSRFAKWLATLMCSVSLVFLWLSAAPNLLAAAVTLTIVVVLLWLWYRPEQAEETSACQEQTQSKGAR